MAGGWGDAGWDECGWDECGWDKCVKVGGAALVAVAAGGVGELEEGAAEAGLPGDAVDEAAGGAAAVEHGGGAFEDLDALGVGEVAVVLRIVADTVDVHVVHGVEAAEEEVVAAAFAELQAGGWDELKGGLHGLGGAGAEQLRGEDVELLGCLEDGERKPCGGRGDGDERGVGVDVNGVGGGGDGEDEGEGLWGAEVDRLGEGLEAAVRECELVEAGRERQCELAVRGGGAVQGRWAGEVG